MPLNDFKLVDTTLREGEQSAKVSFSQQERLEVVHLLDKFGVEYIELLSPVISKEAQKICSKIADLNLEAQIVTHVRTKIEDVEQALETGVDGVNLFFATSEIMKHYSHGKSTAEIIDSALEVVDFISQQAPEVEIRFSAEDTFRSDEADLVQFYQALANRREVDRLGAADTVGTALPEDVAAVINLIRELTAKDIEFHSHNDTGSAVINSYTALKAGATHIDTSLLGVGERNGITPLAGLLAILNVHQPAVIASKYNLKFLEELIAEFAAITGIKIPFNHPLVGATAFCHKAGVHTNAVLEEPSTYEGVRAEDFGVERQIMLAHPLVGQHAVKARAKELGLQIAPKRLKELTAEIKEIAFKRGIDLAEVDELLKDRGERI